LLLGKLVVDIRLRQIGIHFVELPARKPFVLTKLAQPGFENDARNYCGGGVVARSKKLLRLFQFAGKYAGLDEIPNCMKVPSIVVFFGSKEDSIHLLK
jgi:hypothetical protein